MYMIKIKINGLKNGTNEKRKKEKNFSLSLAGGCRKKNFSKTAKKIKKNKT